MGYNCEQFRLLIRQVCTDMKLWSPDVENLLLATAAVESRFGSYITQLGGGPGVGAFQVEPKTEMDIWVNYLNYRHDRAYTLFLTCGVDFYNPYQMQVNLAYGIIMARLKYRMIPVPLPPGNDVLAMGRYWKEYYNTIDGKGTLDDFVRSWNTYVAGE